jgi:hypothetical protein
VGRARIEARTHASVRAAPPHALWIAMAALSRVFIVGHLSRSIAAPMGDLAREIVLCAAAQSPTLGWWERPHGAHAVLAALSHPLVRGGRIDEMISDLPQLLVLRGGHPTGLRNGERGFRHRTDALIILP